MVKKRVEKKERKICLECSKYIDLSKDHHVQIHTLNRVEKKDDHQYFHFSCWVDYFNKCVEKKMKVNVAGMQDQAISLFNSPQLKSLFDQIQGSGMLLNMLKIPLNADQVISKEKVERKIQNDRKTKRSGKKRSD